MGGRSSMTVTEDELEQEPLSPVMRASPSTCRVLTTD